MAPRVASPEKSSIRLPRRSMVHPDPAQNRRGPCNSLFVGSAVDAYWHDVWWEGVVTCKELDGKLCVYYLGIYLSSLHNKWNHMKECQVVVSSLLSMDRGIFQVFPAMGASQSRLQGKLWKQRPSGASF